MSGLVTRHKRIVFSVFLTLALISAVFTTLVSVNYDMVDYLPQDAQSTIAISIMEEEFSGDVPNSRVMLMDVAILEALDYKKSILAIPGVTSVSWLDDVLGKNILLATPLEFLDASITDNYYKNGNALLSVSIESGKESAVMESIYDLIGENDAVAGDAANASATQDMAVSEVLNAMIILLPTIIIILILSTTSWIEPLLFLFTIGIAVIINMGTNVFFGEISFITQTVSPILQLAVSLDYAIFLLHSFNDYRESHEPDKAMQLAMKRALPTVAGSAATTVIGFSALMFMRFGIGSDLGINLVKGVILSFLSVMIFLPALTLVSYKLIDKTQHKNFVPSFYRIGKGLMKARVIFLILALIVVIPSFLAQSSTGFMYGMDGIAESSRVGRDAALIEGEFGKENPLVLLVPKGNPGRETELCDELSSIPNVTSVVSFVTAVGAEIPPQYVPEEALNQFYSQNYSRIILNTDNPEEGEQSFDTVLSVMDTAALHYDTYYLTGQSATLFDMKDVVEVDTGIVNLVAVLGIFVVLLITFRSLTIPIFLVFSIETAIWINLSFGYFTDSTLSFIGYLIISTVQLGATVDYAILLTNRYLIERKILPKNDAMLKTLSDNLVAILVSACILATAGFTLGATSSNPIISELGILLGRGTALSFVMVVCVLPALLVIFDKVIEKTTLKNDFYIDNTDNSI
ncbi:MMPL family transporter [Alkalibaculum sp. M08DMB]|uniref:MMPL family transporter n=1 Tax=Alkalibaculum sporogenes TaxID=2655001 RepID=A0A6A7K8A8_9FIRM|nr:MMPL family transporter [Alkalibaculum sporogenes]